MTTLTMSVPLALWLANGWSQLMLMVGRLLIVLIVELLNSAIEATVDRISYEHNVLSKRAKDMGSAAVLLALLLLGLVWGSVICTRLNEAFQRLPS